MPNAKNESVYTSSQGNAPRLLGFVMEYAGSHSKIVRSLASIGPIQSRPLARVHLDSSGFLGLLGAKTTLLGFGVGWQHVLPNPTKARDILYLVGPHLVSLEYTHLPDLMTPMAIRHSIYPAFETAWFSPNDQPDHLWQCTQNKETLLNEPGP